MGILTNRCWRWVEDDRDPLAYPAAPQHQGEDILAIAWLPKATVQAARSVFLDNAIKYGFKESRSLGNRS